MFLWIAIGCAILFLLMLGGLMLLHQYPSVSAHGASTLRGLIGDQAVAAMETVVFTIEDTVNQVGFRLGLFRTTDPFAIQSQPVSAKAASPVSTQVEAASATQVAPAAMVTTEAPLLSADATTAARKTDALAWQPAPAKSRGNQTGEGVWKPYINNASGKVVAYRTFLQPDPDRPYVLIGAVAFDLSSTQLHYVIGADDPYASENLPRQTGAIPPADLQPNILLAAFNGGFLYQHGNFGSMASRFTSVPMRDGLSAVAIYKDGSVKIGEWGKDIQDVPDLVAARQNGPLMIQAGQVSALTNNPQYWGHTLKGETVAWRSGLAISPDGKTLYYFAGPSLTAPVLVNAMSAVSPEAAMQLDINNYWVQFVSIRATPNGLDSIPLFPKDMLDRKDRYLQPFDRDFFYVTANED